MLLFIFSVLMLAPNYTFQCGSSISQNMTPADARGGIVFSIGNLKKLYSFTWEHNTLAYVLLWALRVSWSQNSQIEPEEQRKKLTWSSASYLMIITQLCQWLLKFWKPWISLHAFSIGFISAGKRRVEFQLPYFRLPILSVFSPLDMVLLALQKQLRKFGDFSFPPRNLDLLTMIPCTSKEPISWKFEYPHLWLVYVFSLSLRLCNYNATQENFTVWWIKQPLPSLLCWLGRTVSHCCIIATFSGQLIITFTSTELEFCTMATKCISSCNRPLQKLTGCFRVPEKGTGPPHHTAMWRLIPVLWKEGTVVKKTTNQTKPPPKQKTTTEAGSSVIKTPVSGIVCTYGMTDLILSGKLRWIIAFYISQISRTQLNVRLFLPYSVCIAVMFCLITTSLSWFQYRHMYCVGKKYFLCPFIFLAFHVHKHELC